MAKLANVAFDMWHELGRREVSRRSLRGGLNLELYKLEEVHELRLSRPAVVPSETEIEICRKLFGVPPDAEREGDNTTVVLRWPRWTE